MKRLMFVFLMLCNSTIYAQNAINLIGNWHNQRGSTLNISSINPTTGLITGTYTIRTPAPGTFPLTGYVHLNVAGSDRVSTLITFCVNFPYYKTMTAWTGYITPSSTNVNVLTIHTVWHLVSAAANAPYNHVTTDVDDFTR